MAYYRRRYYKPWKYHRYRSRRTEPRVFGLFVILLSGIFISLSTFFSRNLSKIIGVIFILGILIVVISLIFYFLKRQRKPNDLPIFVADESIVAEERNKSAKEDSAPRYELKTSLITPTEEAFLKVLEEVVTDKYRIVPQVQLSRIIEPIDSNSHFTNYHDFNRIKAKSVDFVLYDQDLIKPFLVIELDDYSHSRPDRVERDEFVNKVMNEVGLKIIHVPVSSQYDKEDLIQKIFQK